MFGRRCSLCNGKLDSKNICKECGLDNTKSDKYYKINQSSCDDMPLTHVHEEKKLSRKSVNKKMNSAKTKKEVKQIKNGKGKKQKSKLSIILSIIIMVIGLISSLVGIFKEITVTDTIAEPEYYEEAYSPYDYVDKIHPEDGDYAEYAFTSGEYVVGVHLPEGDYKALVDDGFDTVQVKDNENGIYLYEYEEKSGGNYLKDLRLFNGAIVTITTRTKVELQTSNAQYQTMNIALDNQMKDVHVVKVGDAATAGTDFDAGIYNLYAAADYAYVYLKYEDQYGEEMICYNGLEIGEESEHGMTYQNVVLPEGAVIWCEEGDIELMPASVIGDIDYSRYYW